MRRAIKRSRVFATTLVLLLTALAVVPAAAANQAATTQGASITSQPFGEVNSTNRNTRNRATRSRYGPSPTAGG